MIFILQSINRASESKISAVLLDPRCGKGSKSKVSAVLDSRCLKVRWSLKEKLRNWDWAARVPPNKLMRKLLGLVLFV